MDEFAEKIKKLAGTYGKNSDEFTNIIDKSFKPTPDKKKDLFLDVGATLYNLSYFSLSITVWNKALEYFLMGNDKSGESKCYTNLGVAYRNLGDYKKAVEYHERSLEIEIEIGNKKGESKCYINLGIAYDNLGDSKKAIEYYSKALKIAKEIGNRRVESSCYINLGIAYDNLGDFKKAIEYYSKALKIAKEIGNKKGESKCYTNLGIAYNSLGDFRKAIEYHKRALKIDIKIDDKAGESKCYTNLGVAYRNLGNFKKAVEYHEKALKIDIKIGDKKGESKCYTNLGAAYDSIGDFRKAIEYHKRALKIDIKIGDKSGESNCYIGLGDAYWNLGDFNKDVKYHKRALEIKIEIGDKSGESKCYTNLGIAYNSLGDFRKAPRYYKKALKIAKKIGNMKGESNCYGNLGNAYDSIGDFDKAIEHHKKALEIAIEIGDKEGELKCYGNLGIAYYNLRDFNKAIEYHKRSLEIAIKITDLDSERIDTCNLAQIYGDKLNNPKRAYDYCRKSIELSEKIAGGLIEEKHKIGFTSRVSDAYQYIVPLCLKLEKMNESFEFTEQGKSRTFLELLAATEINPSVKVTHELKLLLDEEETYLVKLREIQTRHLRKSNVTQEPGEIDKTFDKLNLIYKKIEKLDSEYVFTRRGKPLSFAKLQDTLTSQKKDTVLIEYFITKDKVFIFIVSSKDKKLHIEGVPISQERLNLYIENYLRKVSRCQDFEDIKDSWLGLNNCLVDPISEYLTKGDLIYFIPYGLLHYLPLHALELNGESLIKRHPVAYLPSASLIRFCQNKGSGKLKTCVSFGVVFEDEAEKVAELFKVKPYIRSNATKYKVVEACTNKDIIHFSCHGKFNYIDPLSSGVILYNKEILTAREIFSLKLNTELVTLSACDTGINDRKPGDELVGLTRAFIYAGVPSVIVSLWSVDAKSTQELMLIFYKLLKKGEDKATALQKAQVKIMKDYPHPYHWSPFVLVGDWG